MAAILLVVIVIVATIDGLRIRAEVWEREIQRANAPAHETVRPESMPALPTVSDTSRVADGVDVLEASTKYVVRDTDLRSGPGTEYASIRELVAGEQVGVLTAPIEIQGRRWQMVKVHDGGGDDRTGWCMLNELVVPP